jgi:polyferredoxin
VRNADGSFIDTVRHFNWKIILRFRTLLYFGVWALVGLGLVYALLSRDRLEVNVLHDRNPQFVLESDGSIRNGFTVRLLNMIPEPRTILLSMEGLPEATMKITGVTDLPGRLFAIQVEPDKTLALKVFVTLPKDAISAEATDFHFVAEDRSSHEKDSHPAVFNTPGPRK